MNSLNILSARVSPPPSPSPSRSNSYGNILASSAGKESRRGSRGDASVNEKVDGPADTADVDSGIDEVATEDTPLLNKENDSFTAFSAPSIISRISSGIIESIRWVLSTLATPGVYFIACLYDENGRFAPFSQMGKLGNIFGGSARRGSTAQALGIDSGSSVTENNYKKSVIGRRGLGKESRIFYSNSSSSGLSSDSESERDRSMSDGDGPTASSRHIRSKSLQPTDEIAPARRSIRIKLHNDDTLRQRRHRKTQSTSSQSNASSTTGEISPATLKSPTSPATSLSMTKYPKAPAPPRPLIPRRQPSYTLLDNPSPTQKTLILDLDETLIHSMAKGGRMSTGHMVEVKLAPIPTAPGATPVPQHPILYYVHKRPHCDDFLRRVSFIQSILVLYLFVAGLQMVQPGYFHSFSPRIRRSRDRLVRAGAQILFRSILSPALYIPRWCLH